MNAKGVLFVLLFVSNGLLACDSLSVDTIPYWGCFQSPPVFKDGGEEGMMKFIRENFNYSTMTELPFGEIVIGFTVDTLGNTKDIEIKRGLRKTIDEEVVRIVTMMTFIPVRDRGQLIEVKMTLPFVIKDGEEKKK